MLLSVRFLSYENKGSEINFTSLIAEAGEVSMGRKTFEYEEALWHIDSDGRAGLSKIARCKMSSAYRTVVPLARSRLSFSRHINDIMRARNAHTCKQISKSDLLSAG